MTWLAFWLFVSVTIVAWGLTMAVKKVALYFGVLDIPSGHERKLHQKPIPLLGGLVLWVIFAVTLTIILCQPQLVAVWGSVEPKHLSGLLIAITLLTIGGVADDKWNLRPWQQLICPILAVLTIVASGIGISYITNPGGGLLYLDQWRLTVLTINNVPYRISVFADLVTLCWLLGMTYTTKFLDGVDGAVSGVSIVGALALVVVALHPDINEPLVAVLALIMAAAMAGFLPHNWSPASIFLGESGSLLTGFLLGVLAIMADGKIIITLMVLGLPALDVLWTIIRRIWHRQSPFSTADAGHLHHRLLRAGLSAPHVTIFLMILAAAFGGWGIISDTLNQRFSLIVAALLMVGVIGFLIYRDRDRQKII